MKISVDKKQYDKMRFFIYSALYPIMSDCGNSYSNAWCEHLLRIAKEVGCYNGNVIGDIIELKKSLTNDIDNGMYKELEDIGEWSFDEYLEATKDRKELIKYVIDNRKVR